MNFTVSDITKVLIKEMQTEDLACRIGVSVNTLYRWIRNESNPKLHSSITSQLFSRAISLMISRYDEREDLSFNSNDDAKESW